MNWIKADTPPDVFDTSYGYMQSHEVLIFWDGEPDLGMLRIDSGGTSWVRSEDGGLISPSSSDYQGRVTHYCEITNPS